MSGTESRNRNPDVVCDKDGERRLEDRYGVRGRGDSTGDTRGLEEVRHNKPPGRDWDVLTPTETGREERSKERRSPGPRPGPDSEDLLFDK